MAKLTYHLGGVHHVKSNFALTVVRTLHDVTLAGDNTRIGAPGIQVAFPLQIMNAGNVVDTFTPSAGQFNPRVTMGVSWYYDMDDDGRLTANDMRFPDSNRDGLQDTGPLAPAVPLNVLAVVDVPKTASPDRYTTTFKVQAASTPAV